MFAGGGGGATDGCMCVPTECSRRTSTPSRAWPPSSATRDTGEGAAHLSVGAYLQGVTPDGVWCGVV